VAGQNVGHGTRPFCAPARKPSAEVEVLGNADSRALVDAAMDVVVYAREPAIWAVCPLFLKDGSQ
jgi:hypothetical protein